MNTFFLKIKISSITAFLVFIFSLNSSVSFAQDTTVLASHWRIELEPAAYIGKGYSVLGSTVVGPKHALSIGLYVFAVNLPERMNKRVFENVNDSFDIRITFEIAASARYKFALKGRESGPYIGMFIGWENFRLRHPQKKDLNLSNMFCTPQIGYEFYYYKKLLYINPSLRTVFEFARQSDDSLRTERIRNFVLLPSLSLGIRF